MGTSGFGILDNDTALDVYGAYMELYNLDTPTDDIRPQIEKQFPWAKGDLEEATDFWLALAHAQWECKALDPDVAAKVEAIVDQDIEKEAWEEVDYPKRRTALKRFLTKIRKEKAKPKKRVAPKLFEAPFRKGDCIVFRSGDDFYGGVLCLGATDKPEKIASNILALLRLRQKQKPTTADFLASQVLVKSWGESNGKPAAWAQSPTPTISSIGVGSISDLKAARSHQVVGHVDVTRTFGESVYSHQTNWQWDDDLSRQLGWEEQHPELAIDTSFPVKELIHGLDDDWGKLGEAFAESQKRTDDFDVYKQNCRVFADQIKAMKLSPDSELYNFIASYAGANPKRAKNRVDDILRNAR